VATQESNRIERYVRELPLLGRLPDEDLQALAKLGRYMTYADGETVVTEGDDDSSLHLIVSGGVRICVLSPSGDEATIARLGPGRPVGELSLFDGKPRSASAIAEGPTRTFMVTRDAFIPWLRARPAVSIALLETLSVRIRKTDEALADVYFFELRERLAKALIQRIEDMETAHSSTGPIKLRMIQAEMATTLGVSREAVNKQLKRFEREGLLKTGRGSVTILDFGGLQAML
jgi:CRP/FNR family transcriptional regulator